MLELGEVRQGIAGNRPRSTALLGFVSTSSMSYRTNVPINTISTFNGRY